MACFPLHKSAASVNTSRERCDIFSITLGRRDQCLWPPRLSDRTRGSTVYVSSTATVCSHGGVKGQRGECITYTRQVHRADGDQNLHRIQI